MNRPAPKTVRRRFFVALGHAIHVTWPVLSAILAMQVALGLLIGFVEGWSVGDAVYFTFVSGLFPRGVWASRPSIHWPICRQISPDLQLLQALAVQCAARARGDHRNAPVKAKLLLRQLRQPLGDMGENDIKAALGEDLNPM